MFAPSLAVRWCFSRFRSTMLLMVESDTYLETRSLALAVTGRTMQSTTRQSTLVTVVTRLNIAIPPYFMIFFVEENVRDLERDWPQAQGHALPRSLDDWLSRSRSRTNLSSPNTIFRRRRSRRVSAGILGLLGRRSVSCILS